MLQYQPAADFNGTDTFSFVARDAFGMSAPAVATITVIAVNDAPTANPQSLVTDEDTALAITLTGLDVDGDALTFAVAGGPASGSLSGVAPNLLYTPAIDFNGGDSFSFTTFDGAQNSAPAVVQITIAAINDLPVANDLTIATDEDTAASITLAGSDADGDSLIFVVQTPPAGGALSGTAPNLLYTPAGRVRLHC